MDGVIFTSQRYTGKTDSVRVARRAARSRPCGTSKEKKKGNPMTFESFFHRKKWKCSKIQEKMKKYTSYKSLKKDKWYERRSSRKIRKFSWKIIRFVVVLEIIHVAKAKDTFITFVMSFIFFNLHQLYFGNLRFRFIAFTLDLFAKSSIQVLRAHIPNFYLSFSSEMFL